MKRFRRRNNFVWLVLILTLLMSLMVNACGSDDSSEWTTVQPLMRLIIENQTDQVLTIYIENLNLGNVEPGGNITRDKFPMMEHLIKALNAQGEVIFSETYTFKTKDKYHLQETDEQVYKAVIPPLENK